MVKTDKRKLEIEGTFRDQISKAFTKLAGRVSRISKGFAAFGRRATRALTAPFRAVDRLSKKLLSLRNIVLGFAAFQAVRRGLGFFGGIADELDEIVKTADRVQATTESLSALRFVGELSAITFQDLAQGTAIFSRNLESARRGVLEQADGFRDLGIDIEKISQSTRLDLVEVLAEAAEGFNKLNSATEKNNALLTVFGRSGAKFGPLLAQGADAIRRQADEAERFGVVFDANSLARAAKFNDALTRFRTSIRGTFQTLFIDIAPRLTAFFTRLAEGVARNRDAIVAGIKQVGRIVLQVLDAMTDGIIAFVGTIESIPGVTLIDTAETAEQLRTVQAARQQVEREFKELDAQRRKLRVDANRRGLRGEQLTPFTGKAVREGTDALGELGDKMREILPRLEALRGDEAGLQSALTQGLGAALRKGKSSILQQLNDLALEFEGPARETGQEVGASFGDGFFKGFGEGDTGGGSARAAGFLERRRNELEKSLLGLVKPTTEVQLRLAELNAEAQQIALADTLVPMLQDGTIRGEQLATVLDLVAQKTQLLRNEIGIAEAQEMNRFEMRILALEEPTRNVAEQLALLQGEAQKLDFEAQFNAGQISAEQLSRGIQKIEDSTARAARRIRGDFAQGFDQALRRGAESFTDLTALGDRAATALTNGFTGLTNAFADGLSGARSFREGFSDVAESIVRDLFRIFVQLLAIKALGFIFGGPAGAAATTTISSAANSSNSANSVAGGALSRAGSVARLVNGGAPGVTNVFITAMDSQDVHRALMKTPGSVRGIVSNDANTSHTFRQVLQGAVA